MNYSELLQLKAQKSAKKGAKETLVELDKWRIELSQNVRETPRSLTSAELAKLMMWKLKRGTFRPKLQQLAESNGEQEVKQVTQKAVDLLTSPDLSNTDIISAIKVLSDLKGVGPATASLLGSVMSEKVPFFSDEAFAHVLPNVKIAYTMKAYEQFLNAIQKFGAERDLNEVEAEQEAWILGMRKKYGLVEKEEEVKEETKEEERPAKRRRK